MRLTGQLVDIENCRITPAEIVVDNGMIRSINFIDKASDHYILPGFIDAHVHIESSMLVPSEFARMAVTHGTVATVSDPHEIANVLGVAGVEYMVNNGKQTPFKFYFGAPSCVPATNFETAGASIGPDEVHQLLLKDEIHYLAEMMNWPGVLFKDEEVMTKIRIAQQLGKPIDGHAPGLRGEEAQNYIAAGMSTDHECFTYDEATEKLELGMKVIIREGSAARNFEALYPLLEKYSDRIMFCSDDKHPDSLEEGHINLLVKRAVQKGIDVFKVLAAACINPIKHYKLNVGMLRVGDAADFIIVDDLINFRVKQTFITGNLVSDNGLSMIPSVENAIINHFNINKKNKEDFKIKAAGRRIKVIEVIDNQIVTNSIVAEVSVSDGNAVSDSGTDILKLAVINRYNDAVPAIAFVKNFGLKRGAIASSVAHDSHNIIVVGADDESIARAVNLIIEAKGGVSAVSPEQELIVKLPVAGLMSADNAYEVAKSYKEIDKFAKNLGSHLNAPFMTLSFLALLVIPSLKLSDKGLFDGNKFEFVNLFET